MSDMSPAEAVFFAALERADGADRAVYLDEACAGQPELRAKVEELLAAHPKVGNFLESGAADGPTGPFSPSESEAAGHFRAHAEAEGTVVAGKYKLLQRIGKGGMGLVWMADQTEPVKRKVAVKLIRVERGQSRAILARFEAERQAIALMDHPNIARLLDAGTTAEGSPFFVMELVKGLPLTDFCDVHKLSIPERLNLFTRICSAVQHAHQKGIIHRDLKPSNILVESHDGKPVPKVIDFGLAKATTGLQLSDHTLFTAFGSVMGTPQYMAPEQASFNAVDVDTRADIYALGVILYELLTGTTPLTRETVKKAQLDEMLKLIREQDAPTPSSRLTSSNAQTNVATNRQTEPTRLGRFVRGELDWIVLKALAKERDRRYETANGMAKDIERFLNQEPVTAGPPTARYRLRKFARRNQPQVVAAGLLLLALLAGIAGTTWGLIRADEKWREAEQARANEAAARRKEAEERAFAQAIADFVKNDFLALTSVEGQDRFGGEGLDRNATLLDLLNRAAEKLKKRTDLDPRIEAELCWMIGLNYRGAGEASKGVPFLERAVVLNRWVWGAYHSSTLKTQNSLAVAYGVAGQLDKAISLHEETLRKRKDTLASDHGDTFVSMHNLALAYRAGGQLTKAVYLSEQTLERQKAKLGADHPGTLVSMNNLAVAYKSDGQFVRALPLFEEAARGIEKRRFLHENARIIMPETIRAYEEVGQYGRADEWRQKWLGFLTEQGGPQSPAYAGELATWGHGLLQRQKWTEAETVLRECLAIRKDKEPDAWTTFNTQSMLGGALLGLKKYADSEPILLKGYEGMKAREKLIPLQSTTYLRAAIDRLIELYSVTSKPDEVTKWQTERAKYSDVAPPRPEKE